MYFVYIYCNENKVEKYFKKENQKRHSLYEPAAESQNNRKKAIQFIYIFSYTAYTINIIIIIVTKEE